MKKIKSLSSVLIALVLISCAGRSKPTGVYYGGPNLAPAVYYYVFVEDGSMKVSQGKLETENCRTEGYWSTDEKGNITISGLNNPNCNFMSQLNGTYLICDEPQCIPGGRGYIKGDVRIWPNKK